MSFNYHNRKFKAVVNSESGEVGGSTVFHYRQEGDILWATYEGGNILKGTITGVVKENGELDFSYQHVNVEGERKTGECYSKPEMLESGKIRLLESWIWTSGNRERGESILEEI